MIVAGDIYDSAVPSAEAVSLLDHFLTEMSELKPQPDIFLIAGNHDSARRLDFASSILARHHVHIAGMPPVREDEFIKRVTRTDAYGEVDFYLLPFVKPSYVRGIFPDEAPTYHLAVRRLLERETLCQERRNVVISHQFYTAGASGPSVCDSEVRLVGGIENVDVSVLQPFDYAALGHIHKPQKIGSERFRYCGTPLAYSVSERRGKERNRGGAFGKGRAPVLRTLPLIPLRQGGRKLVGTLADILAGADACSRDDYVSITLTDEVEAYQSQGAAGGML